MSTLIIRSLILFLLFPLAANAGVWEAISGKSAYPVIESGYWIRYPTKIFWVDNENVLFVGGNDPKGEQPTNPGKLSLWNIRTLTVKEILEYESGLCFSRGRITYTTRIDKKTATYRVGNFGEEEEKTKLIESSEEDRGVRYNRMSCKRYPESLFPKGANTDLMEGHGFLGWEGGGETPWPAGGEAPVRYYKDATTPPIMLPLKRKDIRVPSSAFPPIYAEWANVYVLQGGIEWGSINNFGQLPKQSPYPVYLLSPGSGDLKTINTPYAKWITGSMQYHYAKPGLILASFAAKAGGVGNSGLYRADEKGYQKIISGFPKAASVSPDGCRLAAGLQYTDKRGYNGPIELKVLDLCKGAK